MLGFGLVDSLDDDPFHLGNVEKEQAFRGKGKGRTGRQSFHLRHFGFNFCKHLGRENIRC